MEFTENKTTNTTSSSSDNELENTSAFHLHELSKDVDESDGEENISDDDDLQHNNNEPVVHHHHHHHHHNNNSKQHHQQQHNNGHNTHQSSNVQQTASSTSSSTSTTSSPSNLSYRDHKKTNSTTTTPSPSTTTPYHQSNNQQTAASGNDVPFSRIFIICGKDVSENQLMMAFQRFGVIESIKIVFDKETHDSKGYAYIKYQKASSAALAIETMNGTLLPITINKPINYDNNNTSSETTSTTNTNSTSSNSSSSSTTTNLVPDNSKNNTTTTTSVPLKVMIADVKGQKNKTPPSTDPEDFPPNSRLFVICKKDMGEAELTNRFKEFGNLEHVKIVRERDTNESKGCAFVKFSKSSTAALAMEAVNESDDKSTKVIIALPKVKYNKLNQPQQQQQQPSPHQQQPPQQHHQLQQPPHQQPPQQHHHQQPPPHHHHNQHQHNQQSQNDQSSVPMVQFPMMGPNPYQFQNDFTNPYIFPTITRQRLFVVCHKSVTQENLYKLFSRYPGMEYCDLKKDKSTNKSKGFAYVNYSTPQAALLAKNELNGIKYPPGFSLKVVFAEPLGIPKAGTPQSVVDPISSIQNSFAQMPFIRRNSNNDNRKRQKI